MMPRPEAVLAEQGWGALPGVLCGVCKGEDIKPIGDPDQMQAEGFHPGPSIPLTGLAKPPCSHLQHGNMKAPASLLELNRMKNKMSSAQCPPTKSQ